MTAALDVDLMRTFAAIADAGSFTRAAERVGRTQAAVSLQMKRLEALAGCALFLRSQGASPLLTSKGLYLLERARELVALNDDIVLCLKGPALPAVGVNDRSRRFSASILVRPFGNMSGDPAQDYLAQGISAATLGALSRMRWLRVIADDGGANTRGVRYALAGAVAREGGRMRLNARVIDVESGSHLWTEAFDAPADDVFAVQDRIADRIAGLLEPELMQSEIFRARRKTPATVDAYDLYLQAFPLVAAHTAAKAKAALPLLEKALALDPDYAAAHALLAWAHELCFARAGLEEAHRRAAIAHGRVAVEEETDDPTALAVGGFVLAFLAVDRDIALAAIGRAAELNPASATVAYLGAQANAISCRADAAGAYAARALSLSPCHPLAFEAHLGLGVRAEIEERWEDAAACTARAIQVKPGFGSSHLVHAIALALGGRTDAAGSAIRRGLELEPDFRSRMFEEFQFPPEILDMTLEGCRRLGLPA
jgi:adenylate cyclase